MKKADPEKLVLRWEHADITSERLNFGLSTVELGLVGGFVGAFVGFGCVGLGCVGFFGIVGAFVCLGCVGVGCFGFVGACVDFSLQTKLHFISLFSIFLH